jgi:protein gp37
MAKRLQAMGQYRYRNGFAVTLHHEAVEEPYGWKKPRVVFVNSMSDLFHEAVPVDFIRRVFAVMGDCSQHTFQILTKRSRRLAELTPLLSWPKNVWMGVTVENADYAYRIDDLRDVPSAVRFLSMEPLLSAVEDVNLDNIDWVIVGGESGPGARPMKKEWVLSIQSKCQRANVPFFFKQWGGVHKKKAGRSLEGRTWDQRPQIKSASVCV